MIGSGFRRLIKMIVLGAAFSIAAQTAVEKHGWLRTEGPYLLNKNGNIVQLRGLSFYWSNPNWPGWSYYNEGTVNALVDQWKCTVVRAAYDRDGGHNNGWDGVQTVINAAIKKGIYVLIDWHAHDAMNYESAAVSFFREQAAKYKNTPNVIFEPFNEPINAGGSSGGTQTAAVTTWKAIKGYFQNVTQAIRDAGADNLVIIGTPYFCQFVDVAAADPIKDKNGNPFKNVAYAFHFYAASHGPNAYYVKGGDVGGMEAEYLKGGLGKVPIFISEWGTTHSNGGQEGKTYVDEANTDWWFTSYVNGEYHLSWCNWSASSFEASSAFSGGTNPSQSGKIVQKYLKTPPEDEFEPPSKTGKEGPAKDSVFAMPGTHPAAGFNQYYGAYVSSTTVPYVDRDKEMVRTAANTCLKVAGGASGDWVAYNLKSSSASSRLVVRYLAKQGSGTMEVSLDNKSAGTLSLTQNSAWRCVDLPLSTATGTHTLKFVITSSLDGGFLVEWFELGDATASSSCATAVLPVRAREAEIPAAALFPMRSGCSVILPSAHKYDSYRLMRIDGRATMTNAIGSAATKLTFNNLTDGIWLVELSGAAGKELHRILVNGE